jgi:phenylacetate-CoA ligase
MDLSWKKLQRISPKKICAFQEKKLRKMMDFFMMTPYYHSFFDVHHMNASDVRNFTDLSRLPFTTKHDVLSTIEHPDKARAFVVDPTQRKKGLSCLRTFDLLFSRTLKKDLVREFKPIHVHFSSSQTTGVPVLYTDYDLQRLVVSGKRIMDYAKIPHMHRVVNAFLYASHLTFWQSVYATNHNGIFGLHTGGGTQTRHIIATLVRMNAQVLMGTPSYVMHLVSLAVHHEADLSSLSSIILSGEAVTPAYTEKLRVLLRVCGVNDVSVRSTYGFTESKVLWGQCHEKSGYHLYPDMEYIEIVDEHGNRVADGQSGEIVYTSLDFRGTVFLRYKTGDYGKLEVGPCAHCGATTPRLHPAISQQDLLIPLQLTKVKITRVDFNAASALLNGIQEIVDWQITLKKKHNGVDSVVLTVALREKLAYVRKEIVREMRHLFNIEPRILVKEEEELVRLLGLEEKLKIKRIIDSRD